MRVRAWMSVVFSLVLLALAPACRTGAGLSSATPGPSGAPSEVCDSAYLFEVVRYLYRWQLTETEVESLLAGDRLTFWVRRLSVSMDADDRSEWAEIVLPRPGVRLVVKKADYRIEELGTEVKSRTFRVARVEREGVPKGAPREARAVEVEVSAMREYLFRTRSQHDYPDAALLKRLQAAVRKQAAQEGLTQIQGAGAEKMIHVAPLSPVANELWVFWEEGRKLILFASDIDLSNPEVWNHESLASRIYDLDEQVIVTPDEAPGSNRFLTRYQVSRALFNCVLFGQRLTVRPPGVEEAARSAEGVK